MSDTPLEWGDAYSKARDSADRLGLILDDLRGSDLPEEPAALDLGANTGFFSYGLARAGFSVVAVEPPNSKTFNLELIREHRDWIRTADDLPDETFHVSLVLSVLHHIEEWRSVLDGVFARTTHRVYVEVPHPDEHHSLWHGSEEQHSLLRSDPRATPIGEHYEVTRRYKRPLFRVEM